MYLSANTKVYLVFHNNGKTCFLKNKKVFFWKLFSTCSSYNFSTKMVKIFWMKTLVKEFCYLLAKRTLFQPLHKCLYFIDMIWLKLWTAMSFEIALIVAGSDLNSDNTVLDVNNFMLIWFTTVHKNNFCWIISINQSKVYIYKFVFEVYI